MKREDWQLLINGRWCAFYFTLDETTGNMFIKLSYLDGTEVK